ncbi:hypothetical protein BD626DRAFT_564490 [Schizophyllum amplum]|uniref:Uncharacterized protein n=1 Tax=Schizophyllum amplum TaxID=97359 RepID=A0A550CS08_9AGAR|nr:hypothetical protein BD626DRAFT_564490 [Auriculariopsis ampla]
MSEKFSYNEAAIRQYSISIAEHTLKQYRALLRQMDALAKQQDTALQRQKARGAAASPGGGTPTTSSRQQIDKSAHDVDILEARLKLLKLDEKKPEVPLAPKAQPPAAKKDVGADKHEEWHEETTPVSQSPPRADPETSHASKG